MPLPAVVVPPPPSVILDSGAITTFVTPADAAHLQRTLLATAARRIVHLCANNAPPSQPLATYFEAGVWQNVLSRDITAALQATLAFVGPHTVGLSLTDITARSLRASGAMALLVSKVNTDLFRLLGWWRSVEILRYLHLQAQPIMQRFACLMVTHVDYLQYADL